MRIKPIHSLVHLFSTLVPFGSLKHERQSAFLFCFEEELSAVEKVDLDLGLKQGAQVFRGSQCLFCVSHQTPHPAFQAEMESFIVFTLHGNPHFMPLLFTVSRIFFKLQLWTT